MKKIAIAFATALLAVTLMASKCETKMDSDGTVTTVKKGYGEGKETTTVSPEQPAE